MTLQDLYDKLLPFRVGTNRAKFCWEMRDPLPDSELDVLSEFAEKMELELDETDYVGYPGREPFHTKKVYRVLFTPKQGVKIEE